MQSDGEPDRESRSPGETDPTRLTNQPALTTSTGRSWLILGGILAGLGVAVLVQMLGLSLPGVALGGILAIVGVYIAMIVVRLAVAPGRRRLGLLATGMLLIAVISLVSVGVITATEWNSVG